MNTNFPSHASRPVAGGLRFLNAVLLIPAVGFAFFLPLSAQDTPPPAAAAETDNFTPTEYPIDRYQKLRGKSPFEFELAKPPEGIALDPFADYVLAGFAGSGNRVTVYLLNTKTQERITVLGEGSGRPNPSGFRAIGINRGRTLSTTTALVEKDGVQKELAFDPKALSSMSGGAAGGAAAAAPGARPGQPGMPAAPGQPVVRPGNLPARPGQTYQAPQAFIPGQATNRNPGQPAAMVPGQPAAAGIQPNFQQPGSPPAATDAQQQLNVLLNNNGQPAAAAQPAVLVPATAAAGQPAPAANQLPRRRVVLPTPNR